MARDHRSAAIQYFGGNKELIAEACEPGHRPEARSICRAGNTGGEQLSEGGFRPLQPSAPVGGETA